MDALILRLVCNYVDLVEKGNFLFNLIRINFW